MTATDRPVAAPAVPGTTRVTARALERLAVYLVRDSAHVHQREVAVQLADAGGALRVSVTVPVAVGGGATGSIKDRGDRLRRDVIAGMRDLGSRTVDTVDVRYSGLRRVTERRAR
ncbi:hypothetical protein AB1046_08175 [Promicromonospora sp. Populi]|uniref:hypothetical protein n=1 Tax=Promicromonospora sp. Populi TaxID=3239420 RepID=UPI0034E21060